LGYAGARLAAVLYTAKCFWPGVTEDEVRLAAARAQAGGRAEGAAFRGAVFLPADEIVLCLFDATSRASVKRASERAGMPCERVIETVWVAPTTRGGKTTCVS
jgi:Protein of unknown function (DUF4242)